MPTTVPNNEWDKLLLPLRFVEQGSKIVVATRDQDVAKVTQTVITSHRLNVISDEDCWKLFARDAFSGVNSGAVSHLEAFGREIVRKCKGLPLAAKTLGGVLHSVGDVKQWEKITNNSLWGLSNENIPPALTLSYYYLPSHLKRCFAYCAIFPKGYVFKKDGLITEWMAQGFLVQSRRVEEMEDIGEKYFDDLICRSFFQQSLHVQSDFSMHDLISDLAEYAGLIIIISHMITFSPFLQKSTKPPAFHYSFSHIFPPSPFLQKSTMALELIGESILSPVIQVLVDRLASREVLGFFKSHKLDGGLLEKLNETLNTVNGLLDDAEEKQITNRAVKNWLNDVQHAVYEAEDISEEIDYEYLRSKDIDTPRPDSSWVRDRVPFLNPANRRMKEMEAELQKILEKLERLLKHKGDLRHIEGTGGWRPLSEKTTPLVNESHVYGRDADKEAIMEHLLTQQNTDGSNLCAVPIVGMAGIGKTTFAQLLYNDKRVDECFKLKPWVWASQQFDVNRIIKDILDKIDASTCPTKEPDESLMEAVKGKKLLLVLDDAWNIKYNEWDKLLLPLRYVEQGSKIVVTTRDEDVARVTQTVIPFHRLNVISDEYCWKLFARDAFSGVNSGAVSHLEAFGREIVRKCKGLPLAAKTLGGVSHSVGDVRQWEKISNSSMWGSSNENIPPALKLSYYYLPSHLKRCFAYCAILQKGCLFEKDGLITEWMAQGFLVQSRRVEEMEDIGEKYFDDLICRSFFQQSLHVQSDFSMHDLISDLAEYASGEFCFKLGINESCSGLEGQNLCALFLRKVDIEALNDILPNLKRLRMLWKGYQKFFLLVG
ncbi:putative disease resistance RPP13-like protein 1 [Populus alba]|uniref:putative disease resistance RPP13-like protein 1 n=1 Tax=Populus alba TaxID=43335 RepID=UPI003CC7063A